MTAFCVSIGLKISSYPGKYPSGGGGPVPNASITISALRGTDQVAPEGIWFEATPVSGFDVSPPMAGLVYDPTFHDILYVWSFSDAGAFAAPENIPPGWNNKDVAYGPLVSHVFDTPGDYDVICSATDRSGNIAITTYSVTVKNPAVEWPGARTICVALDSNYTGAPTGSDNYNTMASAEAAYKALGSAGRMLLKADGSSYSLADARIRDTYPNFHLGTFGAGARPKLTTQVWLNDMAAAKDATLWGFDLERGWDTTTESGSSGNGVYIDNSRFVTLFDLGLDGTTQCIQITNVVSSATAICQELVMGNWQGYGLLMAGIGTTKVGMKGCRIAQHVDALGGGKGKGTGFNEHGPIRWSGSKPGAATKGYFGACDLFSNVGWSTAGGNPSHQPAFRTAGGNSDMFLNLERISAEGGVNQLAFTDTANGAEALPTNILVDKAVLVGGDSCQHNIILGLGGVTIRNTTVIQANVPTQTTTTWRSMILYEDAGDDPQNLAEPVQVYNCSFANLLDDTNDTNIDPTFVTRGDGTFDTEVRDNNIEHMPNSVSSPDTADTPLITTELWTARYKGLRNADNPTLNVAYKPPAGTVALYGAGSGSAALNDGAGVAAIDDIHGTPRPADPSRGVSESG